MINKLSTFSVLSILIIIGVLLQCSQEVTLPAGKVVEPYDTTNYIAGEVVYGSNNYTEFHVGDVDCPIILSAPHGGDLTPTGIPDRTNGATDQDQYTKELTLDIADAIYEHTGLRPYVVICKLHRKKLDANREIVEAAAGNVDAENAWKDYHRFIKAARKLVTENIGEGIIFDMHGHAHTIPRIEVGYLLDRVDLVQADEQLNLMASSSSIKALASKSELSFSELIRGEHSFGTLLEDNGYRAVPSLQDPEPGVTNEFFEGGYITRVHGSLEEGSVSAIQLECNKSGIRDTPENRKAFAEKMAIIVEQYLAIHYQIEL